MNIELLKAILEASNSSAGFGHFDPNADLKALSDAGLITVNLQESNSAGFVGARINEAGVKMLDDNGGTPTPSTATAPKKEKPVFAITSMPKPAETTRTRAGGESKYPFDKLAAPDENGNVSAFFVAATEEMPEPWKSLTSAVSQANRRYANVVGKNEKGHDIYAHVRKFRINPVMEGDNKGAWIWRDVDGSGKAEEAETDEDKAQAGDGAQG